jgi:hypothetical protein
MSTSMRDASSQIAGFGTANIYAAKTQKAPPRPVGRRGGCVAGAPPSRRPVPPAAKSQVVTDTVFEQGLALPAWSCAVTQNEVVLLFARVSVTDSPVTG